MTIGAGIAGASHAINILKGIASSLKESGKAEAIGQVAEAQMLIMDLLEKQRQLVDENRELKGKLELVGKMTFKPPFYFQEGDHQPFCAQCWESSKLAIHIDGPVRVNYVRHPTGYKWNCKNCKSHFETSSELAVPCR